MYEPHVLYDLRIFLSSFPPVGVPTSVGYQCTDQLLAVISVGVSHFETADGDGNVRYRTQWWSSDIALKQK